MLNEQIRPQTEVDNTITRRMAIAKILAETGAITAAYGSGKILFIHTPEIYSETMESGRKLPTSYASRLSLRRVIADRCKNGSLGSDTAITGSGILTGIASNLYIACESD